MSSSVSTSVACGVVSNSAYKTAIGTGTTFFLATAATTALTAVVGILLFSTSFFTTLGESVCSAVLAACTFAYSTASCSASS